MYKYDSRNNILKVQQIDLKAPEIDLYEDIKASYKQFLTKTIFDCVQNLEDELNDIYTQEHISLSSTVGGLISTVPKREIKKLGNKYYPVRCKISVGGRNLPDFDLLRIPYMDNLGVFNVEGKQRVLLNIVKSSNDISFDQKHKLLVVTFNEKSLTIQGKGDSIVFKVFGKDVPIEDVLNLYMLKSGKRFDLTDLFSNPLITNSLSNREYQQDWKVEDDAEKQNFYRTYTYKTYKIGTLRASLNEKLTLDSCISKELSREIFLPRSLKIIPSGTFITEEILNELKWNLINEIYIKCIPRVDNVYNFDDIQIYCIPRGTAVTEIVQEWFPEYSKFNYLPKTVYLDPPQVIYGGSVITTELLELIHAAGYDQVACLPTKSSTEVRIYRFEQEFVSNHYHKVADFLEPDDIPKFLSADDYVYIDDIENYTPLCKSNCEYLTLYDLMSLVSLAARSITFPELNECYNRDTEFIKRIDQVNEIFKTYLNSAIKDYVTKMKRKILSDLTSGQLDTYTMAYLTKDWISALWKSKVLRRIEDTNPMSLLTQVRRTTLVYGDKKRFANEQRDIAIGQIGKICSYETPEGKHIGLTNSLAEGCRIRNGIPTAPYFKVYSKNYKKYLSEQIYFLSSTEEMTYNISDAISIKVKSDRSFDDIPVIARVPAARNSATRTKLDVIQSYSLDYVMAYPEQHLSPAAQLVPFGCNDDAVRLSFALSRIRQALNLRDSQSPYVITSMYRRMFTGNNDYVIIAEKDGFVEEIQPSRMYLQYAGDSELTCIDVPEIRLSDESIITLNYKKIKGESFKAGDIIVDSSLARDGFFSPGTNVLTAFMIYEGYNYEDSVVMSEAAQNKFVSMYSEKVTKDLDIRGNWLIDSEHSNMFRYVGEDEPIVKLSATQENDPRKIAPGELRAKNTSGIVYDISDERDSSTRKRQIVARIMCFKRLSTGDKFSGRHANKGVSSHVVKTSDMPRLMNGMAIEVCANPAGINSRMNAGQIYEGFCGLVAYLLDIKIESDSFNGATRKDIKELLHFVYLVANKSALEAISAHPKLPKGIHEKALKREDFIRKFEGCFLPDGTAPLYNPVTGRMYENPITIGVTYMLKLIQEVDEKVHARSFAIEEKYSYVKKQPTKGAAAGGGQKIGEMEGSAILASGSINVMHEMINVKSDNAEQRTELTLDALRLSKNTELNARIKRARAKRAELTNPRSVDHLRFLLEVAGVGLAGDELVSLAAKDILNRGELDIAKVLAELAMGTNTQSAESIIQDIQEVLD